MIIKTVSSNLVKKILRKKQPNKSYEVKKGAYLLFLFFYLSTSLFSQDLIILKNADEIKSKVVEITDISVKYRKWENLNGPIYNLNLREVLFIRYENGTKEVINQESSNSSESRSSNLLGDIEEGKPKALDNPKKKSWLRLSWEFGNLSIVGDNTTGLGVDNLQFMSTLGYNNRLDIGIRFYEENKTQAGININPINFSIHQRTSAYDYAEALAWELYLSTFNDWQVVSAFDGGGPLPLIVSGSIGFYVTEKFEKSALNIALNAGIIGFDGGYGEKRGRVQYGAFGDYVDYSTRFSAWSSFFINPKISFLIGNSQKRIRWALNMDYKTVWLKTRSEGAFLQGQIDGNSFNQIIDPSEFQSSNSGILTLGIGISGF
jgi:hypothetical protein